MPGPERGDGPRWLDVCRHRIRGEPAPYVLVLQHHLVAAASRIVAPVLPAGGRDATLLAPRLHIGPVPHRILLLEMSSVTRQFIGDVISSAVAEADAIGDALDALFRGYPVGLSR